MLGSFRVLFSFLNYMWHSLFPYWDLVSLCCLKDHLFLTSIPIRWIFLFHYFLHADIQFDQHCLLKMLSFFFFPHCIFSAFCQRSNAHKCVALFLGLQFYSFNQPVCFCTNKMQFLSLLLCCIAWSQVWRYPRGSFIV